MIDDNLRDGAARLIDRLRAAGLKIVTAESCTGGLIAAAFTSVPGSSDVLERGYVTYSNAAKSGDLGVSPAILRRHGAVSEETARAMAAGALKASRAHISIAVTGIAGPGGGSAEKPVGLVHLAAGRRGVTTLHREERFGNIGRAEIRRRSVMVALDLISEVAGA